jgi:hypothetical protein
MTPADNNTGTPPAATYERLEQWREIAAAIKTALDMGGEPGMDILIGRMAEWNEAVDEWNSSLHTCWELANRGLRDEARQWHAEGFFEVGDQLLDPFAREGWADWQAALEQRDVPTPQFDDELRDMVNAILQESTFPDASGQCVKDHLDALRRNVLVRGDLGTQLTLLTSIRHLDPGRGIWTDMIAPIRRQRAGQIEAELRAALQSQNFQKMARLIEEVQSVDWEGQLAAPIAMLGKCVPHLLKCRSGIHSIEEAASQLVVRCRDLANTQSLQSPSFSLMLKAAIQSRQNYLAARQDFAQSLQHVKSIPETASVAAAMKLVDQAKAVEQSTKRSIAWLAQQEQFEGVRTEFTKKEDDIQQLIAMAPASGLGWEECKKKSAKWLRRESDLRIATKRLCERCPGFVPPSTSSLLAELEVCRNTVKAGRNRVVFQEKMAIAAVVGVLLLFVFFVVGVFLFSARQSGA